MRKEHVCEQGYPRRGWRFLNAAVAAASAVCFCDTGGSPTRAKQESRIKSESRNKVNTPILQRISKVRDSRQSNIKQEQVPFALMGIASKSDSTEFASSLLLSLVLFCQEIKRQLS
jgi:hypothetical protein